MKMSRLTSRIILDEANVMPNHLNCNLTAFLVANLAHLANNFLFIPIANEPLATTDSQYHGPLFEKEPCSGICCVSSAAPRLRDISTLSPPLLTVGDLASTLIWVSPFFVAKKYFLVFFV